MPPLAGCGQAPEEGVRGALKGTHSGQGHTAGHDGVVPQKAGGGESESAGEGGGERERARNVGWYMHDVQLGKSTTV